MAAAGKGIFFDGVTSARRPVLVELAPEHLVVRDQEHRDIVARWPYDKLDELVAPEGVLRLGAIGAQTARLEVRDPALAAAIDMLRSRSTAGANERRSRMKVVGWSLVAVAVLVLAAVYGAPALADRLAPLCRCASSASARR